MEAIEEAEVFIDDRRPQPLRSSPWRSARDAGASKSVATLQPTVTEVDVEGCDRLQELTLALAPNCRVSASTPSPLAPL